MNIIKAIAKIKLDLTNALETKADAKTTETAIDEINVKLADLMYKAITINSFTNNVGTVEKGSTVTSVKLDWTTSKTPTTLKLDGTTMNTSLKTYTYSGLSLKSNKSYKLVVTDERGTSAEKTTSISFVNGVYYGVLDKDTVVNSTAILTLTRKLQSSRTCTFTTNASGSQYIVYAVPKSYGTVKFNVGGFDGGFYLHSTISFTNASGYTEDYYVYFSDQLGLGEATVKAT